MYGISLESAWELFPAFLGGRKSGIVAVVSHTHLSSPAQNALQSSMNALGYGPQPCTFITLAPSGAEHALDPSALMALMEGLDPFCAIATERRAIRALEAAYRATLSIDAHCRLFGRSIVAFADFESMLNTMEAKQKAWALLKTLPKIER